MPTVPTNANINAEPNLTIKEKQFVRDIFFSIRTTMGRGSHTTPPAPTTLVTQPYPGNNGIVAGGVYGNSSGYTNIGILKVTNVIHSSTVQQSYRIRVAADFATDRDYNFVNSHDDRCSILMRMVYTGASPDTRIDGQHMSLAKGGSANFPPPGSFFHVCFGPDTDVAGVVGGTYDHYLFFLRG